MTYGRDEYEQDQMDRGREQQDREEEEASAFFEWCEEEYDADDMAAFGYDETDHGA